MDTQLQSFVDAHKGRPLEVEDPSNLDQCFDLAFGWTDFLGIPRDTIRHLYAYQIFTQASDRTRRYFLVIPNTPDGVPQPGDIIVWGTGVGLAGHVAIFVSGNANSFTSLDQNWDTANYHDAQGNPICRLVRHNYDYGPVLGWLRPKSSNQGTALVAAEESAQQVEQRLLHGPGGVDEWVNKDYQNGITIRGLQEQVAEKDAQLTELRKQLAQAQTVPSSPIDGIQGPGRASDGAPAELPAVEPTPVTPGYKTSELYVAAVVVAGLLAKYLNTNVDVDDVYSVAVSVSTIVAAGGVAIAYIRGRQQMKAKAIDASAAVLTSKESK